MLATMRDEQLLVPRARATGSWQGAAVEGSLRQLGFDVRSAKVGRVIDLELDTPSPTEARTAVEEMCAQLLANPLIESFEIELEQETP